MYSVMLNCIVLCVYVYFYILLSSGHSQIVASKIQHMHYAAFHSASTMYTSH